MHQNSCLCVHNKPTADTFGLYLPVPALTLGLKTSSMRELLQLKVQSVSVVKARVNALNTLAPPKLMFLTPSLLGGSCRAEVFQVCNTSEEGCAVAFVCNETTDADCFGCEAVKFHRRVSGRVR